MYIKLNLTLPRQVKGTALSKLIYKCLRQSISGDIIILTPSYLHYSSFENNYGILLKLFYYSLHKLKNIKPVSRCMQHIVGQSEGT